MDSKNSYGTGSLLLAAVGGALVGAGVAMLLAPKSGRETRQQLADYYQGAKSTVGRVPKALKNAGHAVGETFKEEE